MKKIANFITRNSRMLVIVSLLLLIPSDIKTMKRQDILTDDYELETFAFIIAPSNSAKEIFNFGGKN